MPASLQLAVVGRLTMLAEMEPTEGIEPSPRPYERRILPLY